MANPESLVVSCEEGVFDVADVTRFLQSQPFAFSDPQNESTYLLCGDTFNAVDAYKRRLLGEPGLPYVCVVKVDLLQIDLELMCEEDSETGAKQFLGWLLSHYKCRVTDAEGDDVTDLAYGNLDVLFSDD